MANTETFEQGQRVYWITGQCEATVRQVHDLLGSKEYSIHPDGTIPSNVVRTRGVFLEK